MHFGGDRHPFLVCTHLKTTVNQTLDRILVVILIDRQLRARTDLVIDTFDQQVMRRLAAIMLLLLLLLKQRVHILLPNFLFLVFLFVLLFLL